MEQGPHMPPSGAIYSQLSSGGWGEGEGAGMGCPGGASAAGGSGTLAGWGGAENGAACSGAAWLGSPVLPLATWLPASPRLSWPM